MPAKKISMGSAAASFVFRASSAITAAARFVRIRLSTIAAMLRPAETEWQPCGDRAETGAQFGILAKSAVLAPFSAFFDFAALPGSKQRITAIKLSGRGLGHTF